MLPIVKTHFRSLTLSFQPCLPQARNISSVWHWCSFSRLPHRWQPVLTLQVAVVLIAAATFYKCRKKVTCRLPRHLAVQLTPSAAVPSSRLLLLDAWWMACRFPRSRRCTANPSFHCRFLDLVAFDWSLLMPLRDRMQICLVESATCTTRLYVALRMHRSFATIANEACVNFTGSLWLHLFHKSRWTVITCRNPYNCKHVEIIQWIRRIGIPMGLY